MTKGIIPPGRVRSHYPQAQVTSTSYAKTDSTLPYGSLHTPGVYRTTLTAPKLFGNYLLENFAIILKNHGGTIEITKSQTPKPEQNANSTANRQNNTTNKTHNVPLRDIFDTPDLAFTVDEIANG